MMRGFLLQNLRKSEAGWSWRLNLAALPDAMEELRTFPDPRDRQFHGRTAFIHGADSDYVNTNQLPTIRALFPRANSSPSPAPAIGSMPTSPRPSPRPWWIS
jgi:esterase